MLDLINMHRSHCYNPFVYLRNDNDVQRLVTNLFKATTPKGSQSQDPFWDTAASMLLLALVFYLKYEAPPDEQNFPMVMELLRAGEVREDDDSYVSPLDELFDRLEMVNPEHIALKYYRDYHSGSAKTLKRTAFAANDPIQVVNNLSDFIFGLVRAVGMIMLGFGIVQIGLSLKSHDPSQRANGFLTLAGGVVITFAKEILTLITG